MAWRNTTFRPARGARPEAQYSAYARPEPYYGDELPTYQSAKFSPVEQRPRQQPFSRPALPQEEEFEEQPPAQPVDNYYAESVVEVESVKPAVGAGRYQDDQEILIVGDDNFSFSRALVYVFGTGAKLVTTSHDEKETLIEKYGHQRVSVVLDLLERLGTRVLHGVSGTQLLESIRVLDCGLFDRVVFNFPHVLFASSDPSKNVSNNQSLLRQFFASAHTVIKPDGEVHVTLATCAPYENWNILQQAWECRMILTDVREFQSEDYEGYKQPYTGSPSDGINRVVDLLYVFTPAPGGRKAAHKPEAVNKAQSYLEHSPCCTICKLRFRNVAELRRHTGTPPHVALKQLLPDYLAYLDQTTGVEPAPQVPPAETQSAQPLPRQPQKSSLPSNSQSPATRQLQPAQGRSTQQPTQPSHMQPIQTKQTFAQSTQPIRTQPTQPQQSLAQQTRTQLASTQQNRSQPVQNRSQPVQMQQTLPQRSQQPQSPYYPDVRGQFEVEQAPSLASQQSEPRSVTPVRSGAQKFDVKAKSIVQSQPDITPQPYLSQSQRVLLPQISARVAPETNRASAAHNFAVPDSPRFPTRNVPVSALSSPRTGNGSTNHESPLVQKVTPSKVSSALDQNVFSGQNTAALRPQNGNQSAATPPRVLLNTTAAIQAARAAKFAPLPSPNVPKPSTPSTPKTPSTAATRSFAANSVLPATPGTSQSSPTITSTGFYSSVLSKVPNGSGRGSVSPSAPPSREIVKPNNIRRVSLTSPPTQAQSSNASSVGNIASTKQTPVKTKVHTMDQATWQRISASLPFRCDLCRVGCTSKASLDTHLTGHLHLSNTKKVFEVSPSTSTQTNRVVSVPKQSLQTPPPVSNTNKLVESPSIPVPSLIFDEHPMSPSLSGASGNPSVSVLDAIFEEPEVTVRRVSRTPVVKRKVDLESESASKVQKGSGYL